MKPEKLYIYGVLIFLISCKGTKDIGNSDIANASLSARDIVIAHNNASPNFSTLAARVKVAYEDEKKNQSITVSLRMEKDTKIWVKASILGITLAKVLITKDRVSYYETINNSYFDGDFSLLSDWLGTTLDFEKTQAILLGQSIFEIDKSYASSILNNKYRLEPKRQPENLIHSILLNPGDFKINFCRVLQPFDDRELTVRYGSYTELQGSKYPSTIYIKSEEGDELTTIDVEYKKIDLNVSVSFPFKIPDGYEEIQLSK